MGNPNSGKTTLFNALTGSNQKVGNWPGVTVEQKKGVCTIDPSLLIVDTPGCYSLQPFTPEEQVTADFLRSGPDAILNVVDSTNLERSLLLTTQLAELNIPLTVALNMQDEAQAKGIEVDAASLKGQFGCEFVPISAAKGQNLPQLVEQVVHSTRQGAPKLHYNSTEERYRHIDGAVGKSTTRKRRDAALADKIDAIVLNKWLALPIFVLTMMAVFALSVGGIGGWLTDCINKLTPLLQQALRGAPLCSGNPRLASLLCDGVVGGVMSVVSFVPQIAILFGCIALLEGCGYMSRIAFVTDKLLHGLGLSGRSFVCMVLGCGCTVPAIASTRTVKNAAEREATVTLAPFVPCSAKLAVIAYFTSYVFDGNVLFAVSFYFACVIAIAVGGLTLKLLRRDKQAESLFFMELPPYRLPRAKNVLRQMWQRCKAFLTKAGTVILAASVLLWTLTHLDFSFGWVGIEQSMLADMGRAISPLFAPLGFDDRGCGWQLTVATLCGLAARETVISTLQILLPQGVGAAVSPLGAYTFVLFNLLSVPCVAACGASFAEQGGCKKGLRSAAFQFAMAYVLSLAVYVVGSLFVR